MKVALKLSVVLSLGAAVALPLTVAGPLSGAVQAQALSAAVGKPLQAAASAAKANNLSAAQRHVDEARAAAKTANERQKVGEMAAFVHTRAGRYAQAAAELERVGAPASQIAPLYYQARQYDKAIAAAQKSGQTTIIAQSYLMQGKTADAVRIYKQMLAKSPNNTQLLQNLAGAQFKMGDKKAYLDTTTKLIQLDPTPERWKALLVDAKSQPLSPSSKLGLYHLMRQTGNLNNPNDVQDFAKVAIVSGQSGVASEVVEKAIADGVVPQDDSMLSRIIDAANKRQAAAIATAAKEAQSPSTALTAGNAYLGAGKYSEAIAAFTTAEKGPKPSEAALFKGIAQLRNGNAAAAKSSFATVAGSDDSLSEVGGLWQLYASTRG